MGAEQAERLRRACAALNITLDDMMAHHLASSLESESEANLPGTWAPFLISLGACDDEEDAVGVCARILERYRTESAAAMKRIAPAAAGAGGYGGSAVPVAPSPDWNAPAPSADVGLGGAGGQDQEALPQEISRWLVQKKLEKYSGAARDWCVTMGAVSVSEVLENWEDFADQLKLKPLEKKRVEKDAAAQQQPAAAPTEQTRVAPTPAAGTPPPDAALPPKHPSGRGIGLFFGPQDEPKRYEILEELGEGVTAKVYRCKRGADEYAVKKIDLRKLRLNHDFQRMSEKMLREVAILFALRHPRIVSLFDVVEESDWLYLVLELVEGSPGIGNELFDYIVHCGRLEEPVARYVFLQIVEGLKYIHSKDIVHRDLKPENILVDYKSSREDLLEIKLSDFGHSKLINDGYSTAMTRCGTPQYWPPEVSDHGTCAMGYDQTVDLWSLGVALYVMLIGTYPFDGVSARMDDQIRGGQISFPPGKPISGLAQELIRGLIQVRPGERLTLDQCLQHPWAVTEASGAIHKIMKLHTVMDHKKVELRLQMPFEPTKTQVQAIRRDLQEWMKKWQCFATLKHQEIVADLGDETHVGSEKVESSKAELMAIFEFNFGVKPSVSAKPSAKESFRMISRALCVSDEHGAGLDLDPEPGGMRVHLIHPQPGQPGLQERDLITKINEVSLRGTAESVESIFGSHFRDGAMLSVRRICS